MTDPRRRHYGVLYGLEAPPPGPLALVWGNCQAESIRVLLATAEHLPVTPVRIPPVHELTADDLPHLRRLLPRTRLLASQPVRDGYRELPLGTAQIADGLAPGAVVVRWPVIRHPALHPWSAIVRHPSDPAAVPPGVPYHDLRALAAAAGREPGPPPGPEALREVGRLGVAELARREARDTDTGVSDAIAGFGAAAAHTLNHPGNGVLMLLARRILDAAGMAGAVCDPGRTLLGGIRAPLRADVVDALGLDVAPRPHWCVGDRAIGEQEIAAAQRAWYASHPGWVDAGLARHARTLQLLGLRPVRGRSPDHGRVVGFRGAPHDRWTSGFSRQLARFRPTSLGAYRPMTSPALPL
ncbi:WcbI family polysaccharide biosynthesis putative acetyltransferase [Pseudonocardia sp. ICBG1293]|uniref:WcbI family polysaccharide biosynthesis putative acetyltransferase n=1 Tax=Pseudonocardia sp. ICBG1293 TaxID=2844382 RepID=UPI001CCE93AF|nr:WcbI family polysaccharide biosynthesis putative acetyltransferase [Pseudonocardia sp. ICBG1293]